MDPEAIEPKAPYQPMHVTNIEAAPNHWEQGSPWTITNIPVGT